MGNPAIVKGVLLASVVAAGCAPQMLQAPPVGELRRHEGPSLPLNAYVETRGTMGDNPFTVHETVMLAWRTGGEAIAALLANDLPRRIAASPLGARLAGKTPSTPAPPARPESRASVTSSGSGFLLKNTNLILTNYHVVQDKAQITLSFPSGEEYPGQVVFRDRSNDLALVEARGLGATARGLVVSVSAEMKVGETVHALGYPLGSGLSRSRAWSRARSARPRASTTISPASGLPRPSIPATAGGRS